jgi:hypothetical protein
MGGATVQALPPAAEEATLVTASFEFQSHQVIVVRGAEESTWGTWAAVVCAVFLLVSLITLLSMPNWVRPQLLAIRSALRGHVQPTAPHSGGVVMAPTTRLATQPANVAAATPAATQPTTAPTDNSVAATAQIKPEPTASLKNTVPTHNTAPPTTAPAVAIDLAPPVLVRPAIAPLPETAEELSDREIGAAISRAVDFLVKQFDPNDLEIVDDHGDRTSHHTGMDALCVYALLAAGQACNDPRLNPHGPFINGILDTLKRLPMTTRISDRTTYARALRVTALAVYNRPLDREFMRRDALWLIRNQRQGAYTYAAPYETASGSGGAGVWDNSNSQYGLLGVWAAAEAGIEVPSSYWGSVERHWNDCQLPSGGWDYVGSLSGPGSLSMTCAGVASLLVTHDWQETYRLGLSVGREPFTPELRRGIKWLGEGDQILSATSQFWGYTMYGVERVGLASGFKYIGKHNWYPELCQQVLDQQKPDGSFGDDVNTAYALIFLSRGRHPVLMNKLEFSGYWANRSRDLSNLSRVASHELERPINWQVVPIDHNWTDWTDSPIVYLASHEKPQLNDEAIDRLRQFALGGGMLFLQADGDSPAFDQFAGELAAKLFPGYPLENVPADHPVYSSLYKIETPPALKMVSNGARAMLMYSPQDLSRFWQTRDNKTVRGKIAFEMGLNLFVYAAGKRDLRNRLESSWLAQAKTAPIFSIPVARVQYDGNWDPEPAAWTRFGNWLQRQTGDGVNLITVPLGALDAGKTPFAHITGTTRFNASDAEVAALRRYVQRGGVLLIDTCGGNGNFDQSLRADLLARAFPESSMQRLDSNHPLVATKFEGAEPLARPHLRPFAIDRFGTSNGAWPSILSAGRGHVILCPADLTSGLLGTNTWGIAGYEPAYAQAFLKDAILWTLDGQKEQ